MMYQEPPCCTSTTAWPLVKLNENAYTFAVQPIRRSTCVVHEAVCLQTPPHATSAVRQLIDAQMTFCHPASVPHVSAMAWSCAFERCVSKRHVGVCSTTP